MEDMLQIQRTQQNMKEENAKQSNKDEFMDLYAEKKASQDINKEKGTIFHEGAINVMDGINTEPSFFDKNCMFKTEKK